MRDITRSRLPTYKQIEKMIDEEIIKNPISDTNGINPVVFEPNKKYTHLIKLDYEKKLDSIEIISSEIRRAVFEEYFNACIKVIGEMNQLIKH
ncbi:MAG: hypothetical protein K0R54_5446 [Clostridiaceae bacterium]|nr:hypothetical protein [Clostridiaceae bacterium]MDF2950498.1 hypothetical protein [Anaerocolumna sp.]